jgi:hypothetical protein|tara:strand:+ start:1763 stop:2026 length:264 start_codon:yes stop_codon:yes gene_type:complete
MEKLDIDNVIEAQHIRKLISQHKYLVDFFDTLIRRVNVELNTEKEVVSMPIERKSSPNISSDSDDEYELSEEELKFLKGINEKKDDD